MSEIIVFFFFFYMSLYLEDGSLKIFLRAGLVLWKFLSQLAYSVFESS